MCACRRQLSELRRELEDDERKALQEKRRRQREEEEEEDEEDASGTDSEEEMQAERRRAKMGAKKRRKGLDQGGAEKGSRGRDVDMELLMMSDDAIRRAEPPRGLRKASERAHARRPLFLLPFALSFRASLV